MRVTGKVVGWGGGCYYCGLFDEVDEDDDHYWVIRIDEVGKGH